MTTKTKNGLITKASEVVSFNKDKNEDYSRRTYFSTKTKNQ